MNANITSSGDNYEYTPLHGRRGRDMKYSSSSPPEIHVPSAKTKSVLSAGSTIYCIVIFFS